MTQQDNSHSPQNQPKTQEKAKPKLVFWVLPLLVFAGLLALFYSRLGSEPNITPEQTLNKKVPAFALANLQDTTQTLTPADLPKKPYILNVWGSWCPSCVVEHPLFVSLAKSGVTLVGINYNDDKDSALRYLEKHGNPFVLNVMDDNGSMAVDLGLTGAPESFVVDAAGNIRQHIVGMVTAENWQNRIKPCLDVLTLAHQQKTDVNTGKFAQQLKKACQ